MMFAEEVPLGIGLQLKNILDQVFPVSGHYIHGTRKMGK